MKPSRNLRAALIAAIALACLGAAPPSRAAPAAGHPGVAPPPVLILDGEFLPADWTTTAELTGGATYSVTQQLTGGYGSPPFRFMSHRLPPVTSGLAYAAVTHVYLGATYDPGVQGAISAIDYSESGIILSFPFPDAFSTTRPVVLQDGVVYASPQFIRFIAQNSSHNWETKSLLQLAADDFFPPGGAENDNPDFSASGGPIQFGFIRSNSRSSTLPPVPGDQDLVIDQGVDNWRIWVYRADGEVPNRPPQAADDVFILDGNLHSLPLHDWLDVGRNDTDPDGDHLEVITVTQPLHGVTGIFGFSTIFFRLDDAVVSDDFSYTISDGELTSSAQAQVLIDCACSVLCLSSLEPPEPPSAGLRAGEGLDLPLIYRVRDHVLKTTRLGQSYVDMYYRSNPEILVNLLANAPLRAEAVAAVELWQPNLASLVDGDGSALITQAQVDALESFLMNLSAVSSPALQQLITGELARLGPLDDYVGLTMLAARTQAIGDPAIYLPLVAMPVPGGSAR